MESANKSMHYDVIVIGAGLSGLFCADTVLKQLPNTAVLVLEVNNRCGGRSKSVKITRKNDAANGSTNGDAEMSTTDVVIDEGGMWLGKSHKLMLQLCDRYQVKLIPQYAKGKEVMITASGKVTENDESLGQLPDLGLFSKLELGLRVLPHIKSLINELDLDEPWRHPKAKELDSYSLDAYFRSKFIFSRNTFGVLNDVTRALLGCESTQVSMLFCIWSLKSSGGLDYAMGTEGGAQEFRLLGGAQQLSEGLKRDIEAKKNAQVFLDSKVIAVRKDDDGIIRVKTSNGIEFSCNELVCSANASVFIKEASFSPRLPSDVEHFAQRSFRGSYGKALVSFKTPFWRTNGYSGSIINSRESAFVCSCMDYCIEVDGESHLYALACFLSGNPGIRSASMTLEQRQAGVLTDLAECFKQDLSFIKAQLTEYHEYLWHTDPVAQGCSSVIFGPGHFTMFAPMRIFGNRDLYDGHLHFIGTDVGTHFAGYMEGAVTSGHKLGLCLGEKLGKDLKV